jgi:hypothetical protein
MRSFNEDNMNLSNDINDILEIENTHIYTRDERAIG